ncbi:Hypothetical protein NTJ_01402 [Nesidiocoris tenuis]|uniref:Uncharacterized protein n=1 Tax=Nesidiocoris tenuis TaxID=355587 RepID=A0ABN7A8R6_9HEMI|nr:Hypothetical protein NTJ_01402 [Nesidiocoris tenuis]
MLVGHLKERPMPGGSRSAQGLAPPADRRRQERGFINCLLTLQLRSYTVYYLAVVSNSLLLSRRRFGTREAAELITEASLMDCELPAGRRGGSASSCSLFRHQPTPQTFRPLLKPQPGGLFRFFCFLKNSLDLV